MNDKLLFPCVCDCGFSTMSPREALDHLRTKHPEVYEDKLQDAREMQAEGNGRSCLEP